jgi:hypothetical protein
MADYLRTYRFAYASPAYHYTVDVTADDLDAAVVMASADLVSLENEERGMADAIGEDYEGYALRRVGISPVQHEDAGVVLVDSGARG